MMDKVRLNKLKEEAILYKTLAVAFSYPQDKSLRTMGKILSLLAKKDSSIEFKNFHEALLTSNLENLQAEYSRLFLKKPVCSPYESEYEEDKVSGKSRIISDVLGFYKAFGLKVQKEMPDHISCQLEFLSFLSLKEAYAMENGLTDKMDICAKGRDKFIREHLSGWIEKFLNCLEANASEPFYKNLAAFALILFNPSRLLRKEDFG